jgi:UPF0042 nucleotide-binding protein
MELIVITGMSGAGKSHALKKLEDMGYYCVDNFPLALMSAFVDMATEKSVERAAMCIDCRDSSAIGGLWDAVSSLRTKGVDARLLFLDARDDVLVRRYSETRRAHPMAGDGPVTDGIRKERELLAPLVERANHFIDTSDFKPAQLGAAIDGITRSGAERTGVIVQSFGFKRGIPPESDMMFDVRFIPNPFWIESLRPLSGLDKPVIQYVLGFDEVLDFVSDVSGLIARILPCYAREGKHRLTVSVGCTGGRHRSVCVATALADMLKKEGVSVTLTHRDIYNDLQGR